MPWSFSGPFTENTRLSNAQKLFEDQISGPESIAIWRGNVLTTSRNGFIYRIDGHNQTLIPLIRVIDRSCQKWNQTLCSRPLGLRFDSKGILYVVEPFFGIYRIKNILTPKPEVELILSYAQTEAFNKSSKFFDDIVIDENAGLNGGHVLYVTDFSTEFDLTQFTIALTCSQSGRILRFDINSRKLSIILDNLFSPNGIELSEDKKFLLFCESGSRSISKLIIKGPKAGQTSKMLTSLPGGITTIMQIYDSNCILSKRAR